MRRVLQIAAVVGALAAIALAVEALRDRGLRASYYGNTPGCSGEPFYTETDATLARTREAFRRVIRSRNLATCWDGWLEVETPGRYRFTVRSSGRAAVTINGVEVVRKARSPGLRRRSGSVRLPAGTHRIRISYRETTRHPFMETRWTLPGGVRSELPARALYVREPGALSRLARRTTPENALAREAVGYLLLVAAVAGLLWGLAPAREALGRAAESVAPVFRRAAASRWAQPALLLALLVAVWRVAYRYGGSPFGFDDVRYLHAAYYLEPIPWLLNRYVHIYLVKLFLWAESDPFAAARLFSGFTFGVTVAAMAVAVRSLGRGLQLKTLGVALVLFLSQQHLFSRLGGSFSDFTNMMLITAAVAVYMHAFSNARGSRADAWAAAVGALTLLSVKSRELGLILVLLVPLLAIVDGHLALRRGLRRLAWWAGGAAAAMLGLMVLDAVLLGDFFFAVRPTNFRAVGSFNIGEPFMARETDSWLSILWTGHHTRNPGDQSPGYLALLAAAAALVAAALRVRPERRLLQLMPLAYLGMLLVLQLGATYPYVPRYVFPIVPVACVLASCLFLDLGLEDLRLTDLLRRPRRLPLLLLAACAAFLLLQLISGEQALLGALTSDWLDVHGWESRQLLMDTIVKPLITVALIVLLCLVLDRPRARIAVLLLGLVLWFGPWCQRTLFALDSHQAAQRSQNIVYPYRALDDELAEARPGTRLTVSNELIQAYGMGGPVGTLRRIAEVALGVRMDVHHRTNLDLEADLQLGSSGNLARWRRNHPEIAAGAVTDEAGLVALVRPAASAPNP